MLYKMINKNYNLYSIFPNLFVWSFELASKFYFPANVYHFTYFNSACGDAPSCMLDLPGFFLLTKTTLNDIFVEILLFLYWLSLFVTTPTSRIMHRMLLYHVVYF